MWYVVCYSNSFLAAIEESAAIIYSGSDEEIIKRYAKEKTRLRLESRVHRWQRFWFNPEFH